MAVKVITRESLKERACERRIRLLENSQHPNRGEWIEKLQDGIIPEARMVEGFDFTNRAHAQIHKSNGQTIIEFVGQGSLPQVWWERQRYEVDAGRDMEPLLFPAIYNVMEDSTLPEMFTINVMGPPGVVFEEIVEGGEVKFVSLSSSDKSVKLRQWASGIEYSERLFRFNNLFRLPFLERQFGIAANARQNNIHFAPILDFTYPSTNKTAASATGTTLVEKYHNTIDAAITHSRAHNTWPRRGPYALLVASGNLSLVNKAVTAVTQQGFQLQSQEVFNSVRSVIAYDGWSGTRGGKEVTFPGVTAGKGYLVNLGFREMDFQSFYQQNLRQQRGDGDLSRFVVEQVIYDMWFGLYASPLAAVEEITWPT